MKAYYFEGEMGSRIVEKEIPENLLFDDLAAHFPFKMISFSFSRDRCSAVMLAFETDRYLHAHGIFGEAV